MAIAHYPEQKQTNDVWHCYDNAFFSSARYPNLLLRKITNATSFIAYQVVFEQGRMVNMICTHMRREKQLLSLRPAFQMFHQKVLNNEAVHLLTPSPDYWDIAIAQTCFIQNTRAVVSTFEISVRSNASKPNKTRAIVHKSQGTNVTHFEEDVYQKGLNQLRRGRPQYLVLFGKKIMRNVVCSGGKPHWVNFTLIIGMPRPLARSGH